MHFVRITRLLAEHKHGLYSMSQEITLDIENLCGLDQWGDSRRGEMRNLKFLSASQISH